MHLEIESPDNTTNIKSRLPGYYLHLRRLHDLPVLPIVLFMKVGLDGIGVDEWNEVWMFYAGPPVPAECYRFTHMRRTARDKR